MVRAYQAATKEQCIMEREWSEPIIEVDAGASRILFLILSLFAGLTGVLAIACLASAELRGPGLVLAGIPAAIVGGFAWLVARRARAGRFSVHREGVRSRRGNQVVQLRFEEIESIKVRSWQAGGAHAGGLGMIGALAQAGANAAVRAASRKTSDLPYDATQVTVKITGAGRTIVLKKWDARWADAYCELRAHVEPRLLTTARTQLTRVGAAEFGPVRVAADAVTVGKSKVVPFGELERVELGQFHVLFRKHGKRLPAARVHLSQVPNLHVMLDLVGERAPSIRAA
jgi:hypothetical protein